MELRNYYIFLVYKGISKEINTPKDFDELKKSFFKQFNEDENIFFNFSYLTFKNKNIDFEKLKEKKEVNPKNKPTIYVERSKNFSNPQKIKLLSTFTTNAFNSNGMNNTFCIFKNRFNTIILLYAKKRTIISYNLINNQKINEYKNAHCNNIINCNHYYDKKNNKHLIMSISEEDNNLKIWNYSNFKCLCNIVGIMSKGDVYSACFLNYKNNILFIVDNFYVNWGVTEPIKVYNLNGCTIKQIGDSNSDTYFIDTYIDSKKSKYYIITTNFGYIKSYDYEENKTYYKYCDYDNWGHKSAVINETDESVNIIESSGDGNIRIWNFHSGILLKKIKVSNKPLYSICLWSDKNIFVSCEDKTIRLINITTEETKKILCDVNINNIIMTLKKYYIPIYGECLISQGKENEQIKIFNNRSI